ncbi:MAG: deoxyribonuclease V [Desulfatitalea sp.]|nr:deoxyribonuclease V [Desulfatitalea sp.]NNJ98774.1 deoxyribonuclease V [Desulfatitalea sp.]
MKPKINHPWDLKPSEALNLQQELGAKVIKEDQFKEILLIAGVDVAYAKHSETITAAVVIIDAASLTVIETVAVEDKARFPYIPGMFSFRELPSLIKAFAKLQHKPDLVVYDGQGCAHPRRFGIACHLGVIFDLPTIGCAKTRLLGVNDEPHCKRGATQPLLDEGEVIGNVLRTQNRINPIYVSVGHRISLGTACDWVLRLSPKYRLPETTRQADQAVRNALKMTCDE